jgi:hypothetical protein|nr:MAG TPA: hypothetical protein [Caudoviricetes sp.]
MKGVERRCNDLKRDEKIFEKSIAFFKIKAHSIFNEREQVRRLSC